MASVTVHVTGLRELGLAMKELSSKVSTSIAGSMTNAAAQVIKKAAVANVVRSPSVDTGSLKDSVIVKKLPKRETELTSAHIVTVRGRGKVIRRGKKKGQRQTSAPHAGFVEFGTVNMPAEPFLRPAFDHEKEKAVEAMKARGLARIEAAANKARKA